MIANAIAFTYDHILIILLARLVEPLPAFGQTSLRSLADNLRTTMIQSFGIFPPDFNEGKIQLSVTAAHLFARYLDLQQLSMTLDPILSNRAQLHVMISAWDNLDTATMILEVVLSSFHEWLKEIESVSSRSGREIEKLGQWVDRTLQEVLERLPWIKIDSVARRVGFITSQVMRDFTLKSDQSFGLFQLVKTWIDDWVSIAALRRTALLPRTVGTSRSTHPSVPSMEAAMPQGIREHSTANSRF
nr:uncharacterized protein CI109_007005 [Kwoniella shandongensis]KAA5524682.1 hypothetical protein CI109_007005 [Kwoniella shandongensis]